MMTRSLTIRFQDGFTTTVVIPGSISFNELESAREFVGLIIKYKQGFQRFMARSPKLTMGSRVKLYTDLGDVFNTIVNARKFLDMVESKDDIFGSASQHFSIDFVTGTFTLYKNETKEERGTMSLGLVYSNWEELFYPDLITPAFSVDALMKEEEPEEELEEEELETSGTVHITMEHLNTDQMRDQLDDDCFAFWDYCVNKRGFTGKISIDYSGSGDSGGTDNIDSEYDLNGDHDFDKEVWALIDQRESGFYNNDGGYGTIIVSATCFEWNHNNYYTETVASVGVEVTIEDEHAKILEEAAKEAEEETDYKYDEDGFEADEEDEKPLPF